MPEQIRAFFAAAVYTEVGDGTTTLFWTDRWLHGQSIADLAPHLMAAIPIRRRKKRTVQEALVNHAWVSDIQGGLPVGVLIDYLRLWDFCLTSSYNLKWKINTYGGFQLMGNTLRRQLMRVSSWGQLFLDLGRKSGRLRLPPNALSLCGCCP